MDLIYIGTQLSVIQALDPRKKLEKNVTIFIMNKKINECKQLLKLEIKEQKVLRAGIGV